LFISPVSSIGSFVFSDIELNDTSHWIFKYALEHVKKNILQHIARYSTFKTFLTNKSFDLFVGLDDCNYPYPYLYAVQDNDMLCIGIQHGGYAMRHEGYVMKNLATHPWYDYLIVWGEYWKKIFIKNNKIFPASNVLVASNKHAYQYDILPKPDSSKSILIPYEFLADTILIGKFMQAFYAEGFKIYFKHRSDEVASDQVKSYELGSIANNLILVGEITPEIMASIDIVAGTMTTLLYDLLPYNKPIWILETPFRLQYDMVDNGLARLFCWDDIENIGEIYGDDFQQKWGGNIEYHSGSLPIVDAVISIKENTE